MPSLHAPSPVPQVSSPASSSAPQRTPNSRPSATTGVLLTTLAYVTWGVLPIFWDLLAGVDSTYILATRIVWSAILLAAFFTITRGWAAVRAALRDRRSALTCLVSGILVTINWGVYIFAINNGHVLDASLGYFVEPVLVMAIGIIIFRERPTRLELVTLTLSVAGLAYMVVASGEFPLLALVIAGSFAAYGAVKKNLALAPQVSLFVETLFVTPVALAWICVLEAGVLGVSTGATGAGVATASTFGTGALSVLHGWQLLLLPACGVVTTIPMLLFNLGVPRIPYYLTGILMYVNPTLQFLTGLVYFGEQLDEVRLVAFVIIWVGVGFAILERVLRARSSK